MDPSSIGANLSILRDHFAPFVVLLFGLPVLTFLAMKFWIAGHSSKAQRTTNWFVPTDLESESARLHLSMQLHRNSRHAVAVRKSSSRRSA